jgi:quercetin dioxygenase-like cupin family protein
MVKVIEKPWGQEEILTEINPYYMVKRLTMKDGHRCSKQYHEFKTETIYVLKGKLTIELDDDAVLLLKKGKTVTINPGDVHRMAATDGDVVYLECSTPQLDDVIRLEDDYARS